MPGWSDTLPTITASISGFLVGLVAKPLDRWLARSDRAEARASEAAMRAQELVDELDELFRRAHRPPPRPRSGLPMPQDPTPEQISPIVGAIRRLTYVIDDQEITALIQDVWWISLSLSAIKDYGLPGSPFSAINCMCTVMRETFAAYLHHRKPRIPEWAEMEWDVIRLAANTFNEMMDEQQEQWASESFDD